MEEILLIFVIILAIFNLIISIAARRKNHQYERLEKTIKDDFYQNRKEITDSLRDSRLEMSANQMAFEEKISLRIKDFNESFSDNLIKMENALASLKDTVDVRLDKIRTVVDVKFTDIQNENNRKLDEIRSVVDEKLQTALEKKLTESFRQVSDRLEQVHKGLGEMQNLAAGVGDLKKVLTNVKSRGILGEIQLRSILENIMSPYQYEENVSTKENSRETVEFAVKLPGKDSGHNFIYLPIDSKFPLEGYNALTTAYESGSPEEVKKYSKAVELEILRCAKDIKAKYINPPNTTDFGILFLACEGLYAEVIRKTSLIERVQRDYKIFIAGPTTLAAFLNSLQIGFRTLAIEQRTSEVWKILGAVKTEFSKFGTILESAKKRILQAGEDIESLVGVRSRQIVSKLKSVDELPDTDTMFENNQMQRFKKDENED